MQKIGNITNTADINGEWTNGNVAGGVSPTILDAAWLNTIQRELANVVQGGGLTLEPGNDAQVLAAINSLSIAQFNSIKSVNGYVTLPNGIIFQWGITSLSDSSGQNTVVFPVTFPNACLRVLATNSASTAPGSWPGIASKTVTGCIITNASSSGVSSGFGAVNEYLAIGY